MEPRSVTPVGIDQASLGRGTADVADNNITPLPPAEPVSVSATEETPGAYPIFPVQIKILPLKDEHGFSPALSEHIHLLGDLLGEVVKELGGTEVFNAVEDLRRITKEMRANPDPKHKKEIKEIVQKLELDKLGKVARAFTIYFHLVNEAEKIEIVRVNKERELAATTTLPRKESIKEAIFLLKEKGLTEEQMQDLLNKLSIEPVFTAHPTEVKRPEIVARLNAISTLISNKEDDLRAKIKTEITEIWNTPEIRSTQPTVKDEAENILYFLRETVFDLLPGLHKDLRDALACYYPGHDFNIPNFIQVGSWVGGDRDGNPNVTPKVTREVAEMNSVCVPKLVELDIRQHSEEHEKAVAEILSTLQFFKLSKPYNELNEKEKVKLLTMLLTSFPYLTFYNTNFLDTTQTIQRTFNAIREAHQAVGKEAIRCYITSFTHEVSDMLEVLLLARESSVNLNDIDFVPLFETVEDLRNAPTLLEDLFNNPAYIEHLKRRGNFQEIMLGYSDSNKDSGYLSANVELHNAQKNIIEVCKKHNIKWRFFHGRGGSIGRGGAQAGKAIQASPSGSVDGKIRFTEQGEVTTFRYSLPALAHRHLESIIHAVLLASTERDTILNDQNSNEKGYLELLGKLADISRNKYRGLVYDDSEFLKFYTQATPVRFISQLKDASRPANRKGLQNIEDLRAIPWVFSWTQTRTMLPGWYGVGTALNEAAENDRGLECLKRMYNECPFFKVVLNNCQLALAKADMNTGSQYISLVEPPELGTRIFKDMQEEYELTRKMILDITDQSEILDNAPVLQKSIRLRNPYTDPLNYIQAELLQRLKQTSEGKEQEEITGAILLTIKGIAAAMQETG